MRGNVGGIGDKMFIGAGTHKYNSNANPNAAKGERDNIESYNIDKFQGRDELFDMNDSEETNAMFAKAYRDEATPEFGKRFNTARAEANAYNDGKYKYNKKTGQYINTDDLK